MIKMGPKQLAREAVAAELANDLRLLADSVERAARNDAEAIRHIQRNTDGYWHAIVVGARELPKILPGDDDGSK